MGKAKYYTGIKRYIASRVANPDDVQDLVQSVFLEFCRSSHGGDNPEPYLFGIARNLIANYYRQKGKQQLPLQLSKQVADKAAFDCYKGDFKAGYTAEIEKIVFELPPKAREAVRLRLIDGLSFKEAADQAGCSVDRFYDRFYEGLKILREKLHT